MVIRSLVNWLASRPRKRPCTTLVIHSTAGSSLSGALSALRAKELSYHALIEKNGQVTKCVPYSRVACHAGKSEGPEGDNVNNYSVGISFVNLNDGVDKLTDEQISAAEDLAMALKRQFPTLKWVVNHHGISPGRKFDPRRFDLQSFGAKVGLEPWKLTRAAWRLW